MYGGDVVEELLHLTGYTILGNNTALAATILHQKMVL